MLCGPVVLVDIGFTPFRRTCLIPLGRIHRLRTLSLRSSPEVNKKERA